MNARPRTIVFVDSKHGRGGGQVVLERLLRQCVDHADVWLVMPEDGRRSMSVPAEVHGRDRLALVDVRRDLNAETHDVLIVANANASIPAIVLEQRRWRARGARVKSVAIVHNYPTRIAKGLATRASLRLVDQVLVVEPGLLTLRRDADVPPWLSIAPDDTVFDGDQIKVTGRVKSFGRPDRSKGLHLLAPVFEALQEDGWQCEVALGTPLDGQRGYEAGLRRTLEPWLVEGGRTIAWVEPGDVFVVPSVGGEAVCLSAQEAMARGAYVVASRTGLLPYLSPQALSMTTFSIGDTDAAIRAVTAFGAMSADDQSAACVAGVQEIGSRAGLWYDSVVRTLCEPA